MNVELDEVSRFLQRQKPLHAGILPSFGDDKVLSFMATCASPGQAPAVAVRRLRGAARGEAGAELDVRIEGVLPAAPLKGECITLSMCEPRAFDGFKFFGYQVKSHSLLNPSFASRLHRAGEGETRVFAPQVFTIHHGPHAASYFENVPFEDVAAHAARTPHVLVAVGEQANISPRWIFHHEVRTDGLHLFHGDSLANKTYLNLRRNSREVRMVLDLRTWSGFALDGRVYEVERNAERAASARVEAAFSRGGLPPPSRIYHFHASRAWKLSPASSPGAC